MTPYHDANGVTIYHGDCLEVMRGLPAGSVDAIVTDPPYCSGGFTESQRSKAKGQGLRSETFQDVDWFIGDNMGTSGLVWLLRGIAYEACRLLKKGGTLSVFTDWRMVSNLQPAIEAAGLRFQSLVVWDKEHAGLGHGFRAQHELILHFSVNTPQYHDMSTGNVIRVKRERWEYHPTQKPVEIMRRIARVVCPRGGVILDPFMGSGTTGLAAGAEGMQFIGIERDEQYTRTALERIEANRNQLSLFAA